MVEDPAELNYTVPSKEEKNDGGFFARLHFDKAKFRTIPVIIRFVELILSFIGFICITASALWMSRTNYYSFVAWNTIIVNAVVLFCVIFHVIEESTSKFFVILDLVYCSISTFLHFVAGIILVTCGDCYGNAEAWGAAGFFAFSTTLLFGYEAVSRLMAFLSLRKAKSST